LWSCRSELKMHDRISDKDNATVVASRGLVSIERDPS
jgi:hypothetical protein